MGSTPAGILILVFDIDEQDAGSTLATNRMAGSEEASDGSLTDSALGTRRRGRRRRWSPSPSPSRRRGLSELRCGVSLGNPVMTVVPILDSRTSTTNAPQQRNTGASTIKSPRTFSFEVADFLLSPRREVSRLLYANGRSV